jgi:uncharacterized protein DUF6519
MKGDFSRIRFNPARQYTAVLQQQGRVALDADANEQSAIDSHLRDTANRDVIGQVGGPVNDAGFAIRLDGANILIGPGRYYVDGILVENPRVFPYDVQPYLYPVPRTAKDLLGAVSHGDGSVVILALEVWQRLVTDLEDVCLREPALGQADTTVRLQTVWRVVAGLINASEFESLSHHGSTAPSASDVDLSNSASLQPTRAGCSNAIEFPVEQLSPCCQLVYQQKEPLSSGAMGADTGKSDDCGCQPIPAAGYRGLENQLYRVEIHRAGNLNTATFKWSRENASVVTQVSGVNGSVVTVLSLGPDANLGFQAGQWVELSDDTYLFGILPNRPGELYQIHSVQTATLQVTMTTSVSGVDTTRNARMRRWDQSGTAATVNGIPLSSTPVQLENGIEVTFRKGEFAAGDYWTIPARTANGEIDWPPCGGDNEFFQPPNFTRIHIAPLACIHLRQGKDTKVEHANTNLDAGQQSDDRLLVDDCRLLFPPLTALCGNSDTVDRGCCTYTVGHGGNYKKIQAAIHALPPDGGEVCILPGDYFENVLVRDRPNVVIRGCGWQTHVYSSALRPGSNATPSGTGSDSGSGAASGSQSAASLGESGLRAVFTAVGCTNLEFRSFSVHAADQEAGILLDRGPDALKSADSGEGRLQSELSFLERGKGDTNVAIEDVFVTASTRPAIAAMSVTGLKIAENRIAMSRVQSIWPAVYLSGDDVFFERNWVGSDEGEILKDKNVTGNTNTTETAARLDLENPPVAGAHGGVQIAGPANNILAVENEIVGGWYNGITLGNLVFLNADGTESGEIAPLRIEFEDECSTKGSILIPGNTLGSNPRKIVAGEVIRNLHIDRNRIHDMGMCGIGPVGFFDLVETLEVVSLENLTITANVISRTLLRELEVSFREVSRYGGGAICVPDVQNLIIRDNTITDFGQTPGAQVCGIFVLLGEMVEISRNQIKETRDLSFSAGHTVDSFGGVRAGILMLLVTPPTQEVSSRVLDSSILLFVPGLSALRIQENVVRVAIGLALGAFGFGPFEIVNNHFGSGGFVGVSGQRGANPIPPTGAGSTLVFSGSKGANDTGTTAGALTVAILNLGIAIETTTLYTFTQRFGDNGVDVGNLASLVYSSSGAVLFTNNICQLEALLSGVSGYASVVIASLDHVLFANNQLWLNGPSWLNGSLGTAVLDAFIFGATVQVCANRLQESAFFPVWASGLTLGLLNITSQNISTYWVIAPTLPGGQTPELQNLAYLS